MYEHSALVYWSGLALCLTKVRSSRARCPATALILNCKKPQTIITYIQCLIILSYTNGAKKSSRTQRVGDELHLLLIFAQFANL